MSNLLDHAITVRDILMVAGIGMIALIFFLGFVVLAVNMGWDSR